MPDAAGLEELLAASKPAEYLRAARTLGAGTYPGLRSLRIGLLGSCTLQFLEPYLRVEGARRGYHLQPILGQFGQFEQELADRESTFLAALPDVVVVFLRPEDVAPDVVYRVPGATALDATFTAVVERLAECVRLLRRHSPVPVLVANFAFPAMAPLGVFDGHLPDSLALALARANTRLQERLVEFPDAIVWDYAGLVATCGSAEWTDRRLWALGRVPVAAARQPALASHLVRTIAGVLRKPVKCVVVDLDNTIWGGVLGDDGIGGIQLSDDYPGSSFKAFQRALLGLVDRGILIAIASKNDPEVVEQAFREHPDMLLRREDVAALRVNWEAKSGNIRDIAAELNLGSDALVFFDDNPVERAEVRANAPEVGVIEVPQDPLLYIPALLDSGFFDQTTLSAEDRARTQLYRENQHRRSLEQRFESVDDFLHRLGMVATIGEADATTLGRIAQLVHKTNQFNLTTRRHTQADLATMAGNPRQVVAWLRLRDQFGDQGLICVAVLDASGDTALVDSFLMSCRVMNRRVEQAMLAYLVEHAKRLGCRRLVGDFIPTRKNAMVKDFYPSFGFAAEATTSAETSRYALDLSASDVTWPEVIRREDAVHGAGAGLEVEA